MLSLIRQTETGTPDYKIQHRMRDAMRNRLQKMNNNCYTLKWHLLFLLFFPFFTLYGQTKKDTLSFRVVSYNVENLFDCRHDTLKNDYEFLPDAMRHWNYTKYKKKLDAIARTITAVGGWTPPALVALCEVENDSVLRDLTRRSVLKEAGYRYVMTNSPDQRGIDVALLYQRDQFKLISHQGIPIPHRSGKKKIPPYTGYTARLRNVAEQRYPGHLCCTSSIPFRRCKGE